MNEPIDAINWTRWLVYLLVGLPAVTWLFVTRDRVLRLLAVVVVMLFIQDTIMGRRYLLGGTSVAPSAVVAYVALLAEIVSRRRMPWLGGYLPLWMGFLFFAAVGILAGSLGTGLWAVNIKQYQNAYFEGIIFFLYGIVALQREDQVLRFVRYSILVGLAIAVIHVFALATGFRFRNAAEITSGIYYAGVLDNANSLGSYYAMTIPVALSALIDERVSLRWRLLMLGSVIGMMGSLVLSGSRGGILFTVLVSFYALASSRVGAARAIMAATLAGAALVLGYFTMITLAPDAWREVFGIVKEEGLRSSRAQLFWQYTKMLIDNPFGIGLSPENYARKLTPYGIAGVVSAHNIYLDIALQTGIPGLAMFLSISGLVVAQNRRAMRFATERVQRDALLYMLLPVIAFLGVGFVEPIFTISTKLNNLFWLLCGLSVGVSQHVILARRSQQPSETGFLSDGFPSRASHAA